MGSPMIYRDLIVDYINSDASKSERINLSREELNEIANMLFTFQNVKDYIEPLRNCNTNNEHLEALKRIVAMLFYRIGLIITALIMIAIMQEK